MSNILYIEKIKGGHMFTIPNDTIKVETEVDDNGIMTITRTRNISISKLQRILENSEIVSIKEKDDGNIILEIIPDEYF